MKKNKIIIIAEAGVNHNGRFSLAKKMIDVAAKSGVDYIKFQIFSPENLSTPYAQKPHYAKDGKNKTQLSMLKRLALNEKKFFDLKLYCKKKKIGFLSSVFDTESLNVFKRLKSNILKIPSGEINNVPLLKSIGKLKKKIILSTGMANLNEIQNALKILTSNKIKKNNIFLLQCTTEYTPFRDINLKVINLLKKI